MNLECVLKFNESDVQVFSLSAFSNGPSLLQNVIENNSLENRVIIELPLQGSARTIKCNGNNNTNGTGKNNVTEEKICVIVLPDLNIPFNKLTSIVLIHSKLSFLPFCSYFDSLVEVDISHNYFVTVPNWIFNKELKLETLNLSHNFIRDIGERPKCSKHLINLDISNNLITELPNWLFGLSCRSMKSLNISNNKFGKVQPFLTGRFLLNLSILKANNCNLHWNAKYIEELPHLKYLSFANITQTSSNFLCELGFSNINSASYLTYLDVSGLGICDLPEDIDLLQSLEKLNLSNNNLSLLPGNLKKLKSLRVLDVSHNKLFCISEDIKFLKCLTELYASNSVLGEISESVMLLKNIHIMDFFNNELDDHVKFLFDIPSLVALDLEQNYFQTDNESYDTKRQTLRNMLSVTRCNGPKEYLYESDKESVRSSDNLSYSDDEIFASHCSPETSWRISDSDVSDDSLVLPLCTYEYVSTDSLGDSSEVALNDNIDPKYFEDSLDDHS